MAKLPELDSPRLKIVPFAEAYLSQRYVAWLNDRDVVRYSEQRHRHHTLETCAAYWRSFDTSPHFFCAILRKGSRDEHADEHVGNITVVVDLQNQVADLAIMVGEKHYWGQGLGAEAWGMLITELFTNRGIRKITAGTMAVNTGMLAIMKRSGMCEEGRLRRHFLWEGQEIDMVMSAIFAGNSDKEVID